MTHLGANIHFNSVNPAFYVNFYTALIWEKIRREFGRAQFILRGVTIGIWLVTITMGFWTGTPVI